ncbi:MAG: VWA domain-containing protein, partial [Lachnospiraceae bacterium]|nr:VWA domain-containing protein [Lachnospiraceae bacterium]
STYLDQYTRNRADSDTDAYYFNLYKQTGNNQYQRVQEGDQTPLEQLYVQNGNTYTRVGTININGKTPIRVSGSNTADPTPTHGGSGSTSHVDTRLAKTSAALSSVMSSLAAKNTAENPDAVEMLLITFNENATTGTWSTTASNIPTNYAYYTRWDRALSAAQTAAQNKKTAEASKEGGPDDTYVIFITDGTPTEYNNTNRRTAENAATDLNNNYGGLHLVFAYGSDTSGNLQNLSHTGLYEAQSTEQLVSALTSIMGQINNASAYEQVVYNDGVTSLTTSLVAKDIDNITFKKYKTVIEEDGKYYYEDTYDTNKTEAPAANIATTTDADGKSIKYDETTGVDYDAEFTYEDNALEWNVSDTRLEKGWLYTCRFTVWPSQEAYDLVADLNNGNRTWASLTQAERDSVYDASGTGAGPFSLRTNTEGTKISYNEVNTKTSNKLPDKVTQTGSGSNISYSYDGHPMTKNSDGSYTYVDTSTNTTYRLTVETNPDTGGTTYTLTATKPGETTVTNPDPVPLDDGEMKVQKVWDDDINPRNQSNGVIFYLWKDGVKTTTKNGSDRITLPIGTGDDAKWYDTIVVAPGLMTVENGVVDVKEAGHNYTLTEEIPSDIAGEYNDYSYEFSAQTVRPMEVNGHLKYLIKVEEPYYTPNGAQTYDIPDMVVHGVTITGGHYYEASEADNATLKGENHKTSEIDITKEIDSTLSDKTSAELDEE